MWKATIVLDDDKTDVGTATAVYTDENELSKFNGQTYSYSERIKLTAQSKIDFVSRAKAILTTKVTKLTNSGNYSEELTLLLNK